MAIATCWWPTWAATCPPTLATAASSGCEATARVPSRPFPWPSTWGGSPTSAPADFDGDGDQDLVVAVFGWHKAGEVLIMENRSSRTNPAQPEFVTTTIDLRHGAIHVPVADLNGDGRPDFVAVFGQEHETVDAFLNEGSGRFARKSVFQAPHPAFGSSGIELVDLDRDGDLDVLLTNGDVMDAPLLRPDQGVRWLENRGVFPFEVHELATLYGAHRAVASDLDGDGDLDIAACSFLPPSSFGSYRQQEKLDAVVILEQTRPGIFARHPLETVHCDHPTLDLGDFDGDGAIDLVVGRFVDRDPKDREEAAAASTPSGASFCGGTWCAGRSVLSFLFSVVSERRGRAWGREMWASGQGGRETAGPGRSAG